MSNILAIAHKELKSYFSSPIAYIVIGLWALMYGYFFVALLSFFVRQSMQMGQFGMQGPQAMNVNQQLIRPLLQNVLILILFLMPMVTMRAYAEEKRSGTIELLLTSPLTDFQIIVGKFLGAMALYGVMLAVTLLHRGRPVHLEPHQESDRRGHGDLRRVPHAVDHHVDRQLLGTDRRQAHAVSLDRRPLRRLWKRRARYDASGLLRELHHVRVVLDRQVGRQRTVAGLMAKG